MKHEFQLLSTDEDDIEVFYDEEKEMSRKKDLRISRLRILGLIVVVMMIVILLLSVTGSTLLGVFLTRYKVPDPPKYFNDKDVIDSCEFQIGLRPEENWTADREGLLDVWIASMNGFSKYMSFSKQDANIDIYSQFHIKTSGRSHCRTPSDFKMRIRSYIYGEYTVIDVKGGEEPVSKEKSCNQAYWPAEQYYNSSRQKCEEDVHPCFTKFTRGTAVHFPAAHVTIQNCQDLKNIFPDAFYNVDSHNKHNDVELFSGAYWYKVQWKGIVGNYTNYEIQFTMGYADTLDNVERGLAEMHEGEWSMRFWVDKGNMWEMDVVEDMEKMFYQLVLKFDLYEVDVHDQCAYDFLAGDRTNVGIDILQHEDVIPQDYLNSVTNT